MFILVVSINHIFKIFVDISLFIYRVIHQRRTSLFLNNEVSENLNFRILNYT